jgi:hypothetical protein
VLGKAVIDDIELVVGVECLLNVGSTEGIFIVPGDFVDKKPRLVFVGESVRSSYAIDGDPEYSVVGTNDGVVLGFSLLFLLSPAVARVPKPRKPSPFPTSVIIATSATISNTSKIHKEFIFFCGTMKERTDLLVFSVDSRRSLLLAIVRSVLL